MQNRMDIKQYPDSFVPLSFPSWLYESDRHVLSQFLSVATVLPEQFYDVPGDIRWKRPEVQLMQAVLEDALWCFQQQFLPRTNQRRRLAREAEWWFFKDASDCPFSFVHICAVLGLEPEYVRRKLRQWHYHHSFIFPRKRRRASQPQQPLALRTATRDRRTSSRAADPVSVRSRSSNYVA
jgi:hypothetical protein